MNDDNNFMNGVAIGVGFGVLGGIASTLWYRKKKTMSPDAVLDGVKAAFLAELEQFDRIFIAYEESAKEGETAVLARELSQMKAGEKILFIFGPEGGISPEEIETFELKGGLKIGLGPRIMRAETAPLYALASVSYALELMK